MCFMVQITPHKRKEQQILCQALSQQIFSKKRSLLLGVLLFLLVGIMSLGKIMDVQLQLKLTSKQLAKNSLRCEKEQKMEMNQCKQAIEKGNIEGARIHAENCIRKKNESLNHLRLSARIEAVAARLDAAIKTKSVTKNMGQMVRGMSQILETMDPTKIDRLMQSCEKQFETIDVTSSCMGEAIGQSMATVMPEDDVNQLMAQVADQHGLEFKAKLSDRLCVKKNDPNVQVTEDPLLDKEMEDLEEQFARLRGH